MTAAHIATARDALAAGVARKDGARVANTNAGSLRRGDVIATGHKGYRVAHVASDGSRVAVAAVSVHYSQRVVAFLFGPAEVVPIVHPDDYGLPMPNRRDRRGLVSA